ncbi:MAG TPA: NUDIX domain-containing protein [bacterium]|nr:NUDIX domain-containing protein [bacterium]
MQTTDKQDEILDIVDEQDRIIGQEKRGICNRSPGIIHRAAYVLVFNRARELYMHRRSLSKDTCPGMWSVSCAGHVESGENYETTAQRELFEELGVRAEVNYWEKYLLRYSNENEYSAIFHTAYEGPFVLEPSEILEGAFYTLEAVVTQLWNKLTPAAQMVLQHLHEDGRIRLPAVSTVISGHQECR